MNKKFLSAILFGALMVTSTGTFVSCSDDYDDDIKHLQDQIDKLATKEDMTSQIASLQSALTAAQSDASAAQTSAASALAKAQEALDKLGEGTNVDEVAKQAAQAAADAAQAKLDAANAKAEAIKAAQDEVAAIKAELEATIDSKFESAKTELAQQIVDLTKKVEELTGYTTDMITSIHLLTEKTFEGSEYGTNLRLNYYRLDKLDRYYDEVKDEWVNKPVDSFIFGEGLDGAFTIKKGDVNTVTDHLLVNVAPVNATVSSESLSLINSVGGNADAYVDLTAATFNEWIITPTASRSASTGLYKIGVQLKKDVDFETFDKMVVTGLDHTIDAADCDGDHDYINFALSVSDGTRTVTSDFDVTMHVQKEKKADNVEIASMIWSTASIYGYSISKYADGGDEAHNWENCFPVENGVAFNISVGGYNGRVMSSYVVVDTNNASLSVADKAALKLVSVTGDVNKVSDDLLHTITLSGADAAGIPVPLKLVTIDYTGNVEVNVVWVKIGEAATMTAAFSVTPTVNVNYNGGADKWTPASTMEAFKVPAGAVYYTIYWNIGETAHQSGYTRINMGNEIGEKPLALSGINTDGVLKLYESDKKTPTTDPAKIAYAKFVHPINLTVMKDDGTAYVGQIKFYDETGSTYLGYNELTVKKVLPTAIPAGFTAKTNAIWTDGTLPVYPKPNDPATSLGIYDLNNSFNISDDLKKDEYLTFNTPTFIAADGTVLAEYDVVPSRDILIYKDLMTEIEKATAYPTTVVYNYGDIKYHPEGHGVAEPGDHKITWGTNFSIKFGCAPVDSKYAWYSTPEVYYQTETTIEGLEMKDGKVVKYHDFMVVKNPYGYEIDPFRTPSPLPSTETYWSVWADNLSSGVNADNIELWSNGDDKKLNEFFDAEYEVKNHGSYSVVGLKLIPNPSVTTVLEADVPTTVVFVVKDKFGHTHKIPALTFTVKKGK